MQHDVPILTPELGINVNDKHQAFTEQILSGAKTIETRNTSTLHPYIGKKMGLVRTGKGKAMLVGYVTIGEPKLYTAQSSFDKDFDSHLVGKDSPFHISKSKKGSKWGYTLSDVEKVEPRLLKDGTGVAPNPRVARKLQNAASPVRYAADQGEPSKFTMPSTNPASTSFGTAKNWVKLNDPHPIWHNQRSGEHNIGVVDHLSHGDERLSAIHFVAGHPAQMSPASFLDPNSDYPAQMKVMGVPSPHLKEASSAFPVAGYNFHSDGETSHAPGRYQTGTMLSIRGDERDFSRQVYNSALSTNSAVLENLGITSNVTVNGQDLHSRFTPMFKDREAAERMAKHVGGYVQTIHFDPSRLRARGKPVEEVFRNFYGYEPQITDIPDPDQFQVIDSRDNPSTQRLDGSIVNIAKHPSYGEYLVTHNQSHLTSGPSFMRDTHFAGSLDKIDRQTFGSERYRANLSNPASRNFYQKENQKSYFTPFISQYWRNLIDLHSDFHNNDFGGRRDLSAALNNAGIDHTPPTRQLIDSMGDDARHLYAMALADHNEHAPRIILADLFDEHGHEGAANFMRASVPHQASGQVKLAKDPSAKPSVARSEIAPETQQPAQPAALQRGDSIKVRPAGEAPSASAQSAQSNRQRVNVGDYVHLHHPSGHRVDNALYTLDAIEPHQYTISMVGEHLNDNQRGIEIPKSDATLRPAPPPEADRLAAEQDPHAFKSWPSAPVRGQPVRHRDIDGNWRRATYHGATGDVFSDGQIAHRLDVRDADGVVQRGVMTTPDRIKPIPSVHPASVTLSNVLDAEGANADSLPFSSLRNHSPGDRVWARPSGSGLWNDAKMATLVSRDLSKANTPEEFAVRFDDTNDPVNVGADNLVRSASQHRPYFDAFEGSPVSVIDRANGKVYHGTHVAKFVIPSEEFTNNQGHESVSSIRNMTGMDNISESWLGREASEGTRDTSINNGYSESPVHIVKIWEPGASTPLNIAVEQEDVLPRFHPARPGEQMAITSPGHDPRSRHSATRPDQDPNIIYNELDEEFRTGDDVEIRGMPARIYFVNGKAGRAFVSYPDRRTTGSLRILSNDYGSGFQVGISSALRHRQPSAQPASSSGASGAQSPAKVSADAPPITMPLERMIWNQVNSTSSGQMFPPDHQKLAHKLRSSFEALFGQKVDDQTIMDTLRIPRSFPGADPNHPAFSPENIHLDVSIHNDGSITSHSKSKLPNYRFYATTEVGSDSIQNASQSHSGESGTKTKYISTPHILQNQANAAHRLGIDKLDVNAAFSNPVRENGGYTGGLVWPTYGYTKRLFGAYSGSDRAEAIAITRRNNPDLHAKDDSELTLNHLLDSKEGMDWYTHGDPYHAGGTYYPHVASGSMVFHTHPDSASHRILGRKTGRLEKNAASRNKPV